MSKRRVRRNAIAGQFAARPIEMLESPANAALSLAARKVRERIEIEFAAHGGTDNGKLPVTYADFARFGVHPRMIAPAIRELAALGFVEITQKGYGGNADFRQPSHYRLTYRHTNEAPGDGTHEWRKIETTTQAEIVAKNARAQTDQNAVSRAKKNRISPPLSAGEAAVTQCRRKHQTPAVTQ